MQSPGLGIKDFVSDVGQIVQNRSGRSRRGRRKITRRKGNNIDVIVPHNSGMGTSQSSDFTGLYHPPGTASTVLSQYDNDLNLGSSDDDDDDGSNNAPNNSDDCTQHHGPNLGLPQQQSSSSTTMTQKSSVVRFGNLPITGTNLSPIRRQVKQDAGSHHSLNNSVSSKDSTSDGRNRTLSDGTAGNKADDELDSDLELL
jgi:hypothetical protein